MELLKYKLAYCFKQLKNTNMNYIKNISLILLLAFTISSCSLTFTAPTKQYDTFAYKVIEDTKANQEDVKLLLTWIGYPFTQIGKYIVIEITDSFLSEKGFTTSSVHYTSKVNIFIENEKINYRVYALTVQTKNLNGIPIKTDLIHYNLAKEEVTQTIETLNITLNKQLEDLK